MNESVLTSISTNQKFQKQKGVTEQCIEYYNNLANNSINALLMNLEFPDIISEFQLQQQNRIIIQSQFNSSDYDLQLANIQTNKWQQIWTNEELIELNIGDCNINLNM